MLVFFIFLLYVQTTEITTNDSYDQIIQKVQKLSEYKNYVDFYDAYKSFSFESPNCGAKSCTYPVLEIYDQMLPKEKVNKFPTLLLAGGLSQNKTKINMSLELLSVIENMLINKNNFITKNFRILVLPLLDPQELFEKQDNKVEKEKVNFVNDFPMYFDNQKCFQKISSEIIQAIFTKYLISISVFIDQGNNKILYPYSSISNTHTKPQDHLVFEDLSNHFVNIFKNIFQQDFTHGQYRDQKLESSNILDWFYSASWSQDFINNKCSKLKLDNFVTRYSNRTLPFQFLIQENHQKILQVVITEFLNFLTPNIQLLEYNYKNNVNIIKIKIRGCIELERIGTINGLDNQKKGDYVEKDTGHIILSLEIYNGTFYNKNFIIEMNCDYKWNQIYEEYFPQSLFTRQKIDNNFVPFNEIYTLQNRFSQQIQLLDFRIDANFDHVYMPQWNQIQLFYEQTLIAQFRFSTVIFNQINKNQVVLDVSFDQTQTKWKMEDFQFYLSQFGDLGYYDQYAIGSLTKIDQNLILDNTQLQDLLGLYLVIKQKEFGFQYISLIQLRDNPAKEGYQIPQQGLTCIQGQKLDYFYVNIEHSNIKKTKIQILTNRQQLDYMMVNNQTSVKLFLQNQFINSDLGTVSRYENIIYQQEQEHEQSSYEQYVDFQKQLLGGLLQIYDKNRQLIFSCRTGIKNPFYDEEVNLQYSIMSQPFLPEDKEEDLFWKSVFTFLITLGGIILIYVAYVVCKRKKKTDVSKDRIKIEENYF